MATGSTSSHGPGGETHRAQLRTDDVGGQAAQKIPTDEAHHREPKDTSKPMTTEPIRVQLPEENIPFSADKKAALVDLEKPKLAGQSQPSSGTTSFSNGKGRGGFGPPKDATTAFYFSCDHPLFNKYYPSDPNAPSRSSSPSSKDVDEPSTDEDKSAGVDLDVVKSSKEADKRGAVKIKSADFDDIDDNVTIPDETPYQDYLNEFSGPKANDIEEGNASVLKNTTTTTKRSCPEEEDDEDDDEREDKRACKVAKTD
ncbi:hypothetical protein BU26DRAFT_99218 [Trematosphaeria pertusa]|uniref:Uncharacterized protein n=1 Tax=Trematosphaeria pertusa TaxID=390896 RepID=A0A6A6I2H6_9PLEO|nr:uncharacterized protein BU26DRAFT_99218 [Trematosphaeria pertusa]KAF2244359.1 hypothetical protein BU26DRAFT_99218 [Trematosphaeria pertusa]